MHARSISDVLNAHTVDLMRIPGVVGTGEGAREGAPVILVFVDRVTPELRAAVPSQIEGYAVELRATGRVTALDGDSSKPSPP
jgi:hypothetical protein